MFQFLRRALILPALALIITSLTAHADAVAVSPATDGFELGEMTFTSPSMGQQISSLVYAPDGQSLWSVNLVGELTVRSRDGRTVTCRGTVGWNVVMLRVLKDGSFLAGTSEDALKWFEPPQAGEPLKLRREFDGPEARGRKKMRRREPATPEEETAAVSNLYFNDLVVSPDRKRVAYSLLKSDFYDGIMYDTPTQEVIRVWNLASGRVESEHIVTAATLSVQKKGSITLGLGSTMPTGLFGTKTKLAWADAQTLVVARGLSLSRLDAATGKLVSAWKPANAPRALATADVMRQAKYLGMLAAQLNLIVKSAQPRALDVEAQRLLALSDDGTQLVVWDGGKKLLTLWDSAAGTAEILSESAAFVRGSAKFSPDGTKVAAWDGKAMQCGVGAIKVGSRRISYRRA